MSKIKETNIYLNSGKKLSISDLTTINYTISGLNPSDSINFPLEKLSSFNTDKKLCIIFSSENMVLSVKASEIIYIEFYGLS